MTADIEVPVALHLDHCPDRAGDHRLPRGGLELGAVRRLAAAGRGEPAADHRGRRGGPPRTARTSRARSRRSPGVEDGIGSDDRGGPAVPGRRRSTSSRRTGVDVFAPAIGNAHGVYTTDARRWTPSGSPTSSSATGIPIALHGGTGLTDEQFTRPDRPRLRQGEHLHRAQGHVHEVEPGVPARTPSSGTSGTRRRCSRPCRRDGRWRWPPTTCARFGSAGQGRVSRAGADLRLRRRARRHRAVRAPAGVQPDVRRVRPAGALVRGGVRARSC